MYQGKYYMASCALWVGGAGMRARALPAQPDGRKIEALGGMVHTPVSRESERW